MRYYELNSKWQTMSKRKSKKSRPRQGCNTRFGLSLDFFRTENTNTKDKERGLSRNNTVTMRSECLWQRKSEAGGHLSRVYYCLNITNQVVTIKITNCQSLEINLDGEFPTGQNTNCKFIKWISYKSTILYPRK